MSIRRTVKEVYDYRELLLALTYRDIRVKYKQAVFGVLWVFFMPLLTITSGILIQLAMSFYKGEPPQMANLLAVMVKSLPWVLFAGIVGACSGSLIGAQGLITKIYFPREVVPLSTVLASLFDFAVSATGLIVLLAALSIWVDLGIRVSWSLLLVPVLVAMLMLMATGLGLVLSCANLFFRDVKYIVGVAIQFGAFFSSVYFDHTLFHAWGRFFLYNPVTPILEAISSIVLQGRIAPDLLPYLGLSAILAVLLFFFALSFFDKAEYLFAEMV